MRSVSESAPSGTPALASEAASLGEQALGREHPDLAPFLNTLGMLQRRRDPALAEATLTRALALSVRGRGRRHAAAATSLLRLGEVYLDRRMDNEAQASLDEALAIREGLGRDTPEVAEVLVVLAELALARGRPAEAAPLLTQVTREGHRIGAADDTNFEYGLNCILDNIDRQIAAGKRAARSRK